ncbi:VOC family protein [Planobispora takensis]|uniref:Hydroxylase n=1 Tax=Planobispora takensis TaxID=1367882 RepID=A0A8J3WS39_9ACTN|nr:VOC family protein [Planobispora takensis]GIH99905.1 hydroxylase [Planobispora takensis]
MPERSGYASGTPCWVELSSTDVALSAGFYRELFGWEVGFDSDPEQGGYGRFTCEGRLVAGITPAACRSVPAMWSVYIAVEDAAATLEEVRAAGGEVVLEPVQIMDRGVMAAFQDPTGAVLSIWQRLSDFGAEVTVEPGAFGWVELSARDPAVALSFYPRVFGWQARARGEGRRRYVEWYLGDRRVAGMAPMGPDIPADIPSQWRTYFIVEDADATVAKVRELGGKVFTEPLTSQGGPLAVLADPEFAVFAILQLDPSLVPPSQSY